MRRGADDEALFIVYGDEAVMRHASDPPFASVAEVQALHDSVQRLHAAGLSLEWAVARLQDDGVVGTCGLHHFDLAAGSAEVGCLLARSEWGRGLMSEAVHALVVHAREVLGLRLLLADIDDDNLRSQRLFAALGFTPPPRPQACWQLPLRP